MSKLLKSDLLGLKSKLENLEKALVSEVKNESTLKFRNIDDEVEAILNSKDEVITLNVGGKNFPIKVSSMLNIKGSLFAELVKRSDNAKTFFFDRSYYLFPKILDYLRTKTFSVKDMNKFDREDFLEECRYYGLKEIVDKLEEINREISFVSLDAAPQYSSAGTHRLEDLNDETLTKGICVSAPYHIIIELNSDHNIVSIDVGGYNGNSNLWYVGNGSGAKIYTSCDKISWTEVGTISSLGATIRNIVLTPSIGRYIKFQHNSYLGLGYLKIYKS
jgi:hypothetical protein